MPEAYHAHSTWTSPRALAIPAGCPCNAACMAYAKCTSKMSSCMRSLTCSCSNAHVRARIRHPTLGPNLACDQIEIMASPMQQLVTTWAQQACLGGVLSFPHELDLELKLLHVTPFAMLPVMPLSCMTTSVQPVRHVCRGQGSTFAEMQCNCQQNVRQRLPPHKRRLEYQPGAVHGSSAGPQLQCLTWPGAVTVCGQTIPLCRARRGYA